MKKLAMCMGLVLLSGCTTVQTNSFSSAPVVNESAGRSGQLPARNGVQILYSEPKNDYESIGTFSVRKYKPGWSDPTVMDALAELKQAGRNLGADAVIIRHVSTGQNTRFTTIEGEAIKWR